MNQSYLKVTFISFISLSLTSFYEINFDSKVVAQVEECSPSRSLVAIQQREIESREKRVALVIGNSIYQNLNSLNNPVNDAEDIGKVLCELGFEVISTTDANLNQMQQALNQFRTKLNQGSVGVFYYAGHGIQSQGENYLIPVNAKVESQEELENQALKLNNVLQLMEAAKSKINVVILDACRDNPIRSLNQQNTPFQQQGLATVTAAEGFFIAYSTAPGQVALDGSGRNSPFTSALKKFITTPGLSIESLFKKVREEVKNATNNRQIPWDGGSSLLGDFSFYPQPTPEAQNPEPQNPKPPTSEASANNIACKNLIDNEMSIPDNISFSYANCNKIATITEIQPILVINKIETLDNPVLDSLKQENQLGLVEPGTQIKIIGEIINSKSVFLGYTKIDILQGILKGKTGWVSTNAIILR